MDTSIPPTQVKDLCRHPHHRDPSTSSKREIHASKGVSGLKDLKEPAVPFQAFTMAVPRAGGEARFQPLAWGELF